MSGWDQLRHDAAVAAQAAIDEGAAMLVYSGGWHVWLDVSRRLVGEHGTLTLEWASAAVPASPASQHQRARMADAGWVDEEQGFTITHTRSADGTVASWIGDFAVATLRDRLGAPLQDPCAGDETLWASLPGVEQVSDDELAAWRPLLTDLRDPQARRAAERERERPHREAADALKTWAMQLRDHHWDVSRQAAGRHDLDALLRHAALANVAKQALDGALLRLHDTAVQEPTEALLALVDAEQFADIWELLDRLFVRCEAARDCQLAGHRRWREEKQQDGLPTATLAGVRSPPGSGSPIAWSWHAIAVTAVAVAGPADVLEQALRRGVITSGDFEYAMAGVPTKRGSEIGAHRRALIRQARQQAAVSERTGGTYLPPSRWS